MIGGRDPLLEIVVALLMALSTQPVARGTRAHDLKFARY